MPILDGTHIPERLRDRLDELKAGKEVAARDIKALLSDEQIKVMDAAWEEQKELRKTKRARTKEEEKELGWKTKREIHIEAYEQAWKIADDGILAAFKDKVKKSQARAARIYLDGYFNARKEDKTSDQAHAIANNDLTRAKFSNFQNENRSLRDKDVWAMEDALREMIRKNMTPEELEQLELVEAHERAVAKK